MSYAEQKEQEKIVRRARKKVEECEQEIARIEAEIATVEQEIAEGKTDGDIFNRHAALNKSLENAMSLWELASTELDSLQS